MRKKYFLINYTSEKKRVLLLGGLQPPNTSSWQPLPFARLLLLVVPPRRRALTHYLSGMQRMR